MSNRTWNRLLAGGLLWALIGFWPIVVFALGIWVLWFLVYCIARIVIVAIWLMRRVV